MDALLSLFKSTIGLEYAVTLALFLLFLPIFFYSYWAIKRGAQLSLRPIAGYSTLKRLLAQAAEAGQPVHISLGVAGIGDQATADTMAGLTVLEYVADRAAVSASPPIVTLADPTTLPVAQDILRRAYRRHGYPEEFDPARVRFIAPDPTLNTGVSPNPSLYASGQIASPAIHVGNDAFAYAAGTMRLLTQQKLIANVMVGRFGDEFLLLGETGARLQLNQIGGTSAVRVLPFFYASVASPLLGEEIFAGGAYLADRPGHLSSLLAQDAMRWLLVAGLVLAILLRSSGFM